MLKQTRSDAPIFPLSRRQLITRAGAASLLCAPAFDALAQFRVEVSGAGATQIPFSIVPFRGNESAPQDIGGIIQADLERSGQFRAVAPIGGGGDENTRPDVGAWRSRATDALVMGSVTRLADGRFDVRFRLWDVVKGQDLGAMSYAVSADRLRLAAHKIADLVYEKLTGDKGVFATRIAYVVKAGSSFRLLMADSDGESTDTLLNSPESIISPAWAPDGVRVAYVSLESRKPVIYAQSVTGQRRLLANFRGSNSAPAWSPRGDRIVATLSVSGNSQLYSVPASGGNPQRLSQSSSIDTEPAFSADGQSIYFVSDRGGSPQIYRMSASGGAAQRVTFNGSYNVSPAPSPDGRYLAYVSRVGGGFRLHVMELASGNVTAITSTSSDESPSFAPNSKLIMYATRENGQEALMTTTLDGRIKTRLAKVAGDIREPAWGPFTE